MLFELKPYDKNRIYREPFEFYLIRLHIINMQTKVI